MTKSEEGSGRERPDVDVRRCRWCRRVLPERAGPGRPREFCGQPCRQWDWVSRQRARELQLSDDELVVVRAELEALRDDLFVLACAVEDTERDLGALGERPDVRELRQIVEWLLDAARPLGERQISAPQGPGAIPS
ncbi:MAG: hypothetical protein RLZZ01_411 [Actinomycetota bacterium]